MAVRMNAVLTLYLRQSLYVYFEHIATFDAFVVSGSTFLLHIVERGVHPDFGNWAVTAEKTKWVVCCSLSGWLSSGKLIATSPVAVDNNTS